MMRAPFAAPPFAITAMLAAATIVVTAATACGGPVPRIERTPREAPPSETPPAPASGQIPGDDAGVAPPVSATVAVDPDASVDRGPLYPMPDWPTGRPEDHGIAPTGLDDAAAVASGDGSFCLLVIRHGVLVYERYWNGSSASTRNPSWSIAKSYTSALVGIAIDRGEIRGLDESAADFVPEWRGTDRAAITIGNLVSMTSGLKWDAIEDYVGLATLASDGTTYAVDRPLASLPGSTWTYDNGGVQVLERVFRNATGRTIEEYAQLHLWGPIGSSASWKHDPSGNPTTYANVLASCRDHARLGYLYLHGGAWAGLAVVSPGYVAATLTPSQSMNRAYGLLWWLNGATPALDAMGAPWSGRMVPFAPTDLFAARGFGNQFVDVIPSLDLVVVRFGQDPMSPFDIGKLATDSHFQEHDRILAPVLAAVTP